MISKKNTCSLGRIIWHHQLISKMKCFEKKYALLQKITFNCLSLFCFINFGIELGFSKQISFCALCLKSSKLHSKLWDNFWRLKALLKRWKMLFILASKLFSFLVFVLTFWSCRKTGWLESKVNFKIYDATTWLTIICSAHIYHYLKK